jgi:hypothetical protein
MTTTSTRSAPTSSPRPWAAVMLAALSGGLAACGGTPATSQPSTAPTAAASPTMAAGTPGAGATESNPPGDIPDNQAYVAFTVPGGRVSVKVPEGWARSGSASGTVFSDKLNRIEVGVSKAAAPPTVASVTRDDVAKLQSAVPRFALGKVSATQRKSGPVLMVTFQGDSPQDPVTGKVVRDAFERYVYYRNGERLDLTLSGPTNADNVDPWRIVSDSVTWQ